MPLIPQRLQRLASVVALVVAAGIAAGGSLLFVMAFRPCRLAIDAGTVITYRIESTVTPLAPDGSPASEPRHHVEETVLLGLSADRQAALLAPGGPGQRDELALVHLGPDGMVRRFDDAERLLDEGRSIGFFDFNLLPLPAGAEQDWRRTIFYGALPPGRRGIQCRIRRVGSGVDPVFELRPVSTIEWVEQRGGARRWLQLRDLVVRYRYASARAMVDHAEIRFLVVTETEEGSRSTEVRLNVHGHRQETGGDPVALRDLALATVDAQTRLEDGRSGGLDRLAARLQALDPAATHPRLQALAVQLVSDGRLDVREHVDPRRGDQHYIQVASVAPSRRSAAEALAQRLAADGYAATVRERGTWLTVLVGPYRQRDPAILHELTRRLGDAAPIWVGQ